MKQRFAILFTLFFTAMSIGQTVNPAPSGNGNTLARPTWVAIHVGGGMQVHAGGWRERYKASAMFDLGAEYQHKERWLLGFN
ncbi:MAG: hypothetical protein ACKOI1_08055 [Bacteroidota bacterium]